MGGGTSSASDAEPRIVISGLSRHPLRVTPLRHPGSRGFDHHPHCRFHLPDLLSYRCHWPDNQKIAELLAIHGQYPGSLSLIGGARSTMDVKQDPNTLTSGEDRRVLIVDDEKTVSETLTKIFKSHGYQARAVHSAEEAVDVFAEWQPDLALLDVNLPGMNGVDVAIVLRTSHPNCRILLFSGYPSTDDLLHLAMQGGHVFEIISKPVHPAELLDAVANSLSDTPDHPPTTSPKMN
jgi:CheY-like chemotaxis protein